MEKIGERLGMDREAELFVAEQKKKLGWGNSLLEEEVVRGYLGVSSKMLQNFRLGKNRRNVKLVPVRLGKKNVRYIPDDVLRFVWECRDN